MQFGSYQPLSVTDAEDLRSGGQPEDTGGRRPHTARILGLLLLAASALLLLAGGAAAGAPTTRRSQLRLLEAAPARLLLLARFRGQWTDRQDPGGDLFTIEGDTLFWDAPPAKTKITPDAQNGFLTELTGPRDHSHAVLVGSELRWNNGDVWIPAAGSRSFEGTWTSSRSRSGNIFAIKGSSLFFNSLPVDAEVTFGRRNMSVVLRGRHLRFRATLAINELHWQDGDVWIRTSAGTPNITGAAAFPANRTAGGRVGAALSKSLATRLTTATTSAAVATTSSATTGPPVEFQTTTGAGGAAASTSLRGGSARATPGDGLARTSRGPKGSAALAAAPVVTEAHAQPMTMASTRAPRAVAPLRFAQAPAAAAMPPPCWEEDVSYEPLNMDGVLVGSPVPDVRACQQKCASTAGCFHFSYWKPGKQCHLQDILALRQTSRLGFVSGPFRCWENLGRKADYYRVGNTVLPHVLRCIEVASTYSPALPGGVRQIRAVEVADAISECQRYCAHTPGCAHFMIHFPGGHCSLAGAWAVKVHPVFKAVAGPPSCAGHITS